MPASQFRTDSDQANAPTTRMRGEILTKAVLRASRELGLQNKELAAIIGCSNPSISRMSTGAYVLEEGSKPFELAALLVRVFRSLDTIAGSDPDYVKAWIRNENTALHAKPIDALKTIHGLTEVLYYLDSRRARV